MRYLCGCGYSILVPALPLIFLYLKDGFSNLVVEAASSPLTGKNSESYSAYSVGKEKQGLRANNVLPAASKLSRNPKLKQISVVGAIVLVILALGFGTMYGVKSYRLKKEKKKFKEELAFLIELSRELKGECYFFTEMFTNLPYPETDELIDEAHAMTQIPIYKEEFFKDTSKDQIKVKEEVWENYLYPFLIGSDMKSKKRVHHVVSNLHMWLKLKGFDDQYLRTYDVSSVGMPKVDQDGLRLYISNIKKRKADPEIVRKLEYFEENYKAFFALMTRYTFESNRLRKIILSKHPDVARVSFWNHVRDNN